MTMKRTPSKCASMPSWLRRAPMGDRRKGRDLGSPTSTKWVSLLSQSVREIDRFYFVHTYDSNMTYNANNILASIIYELCILTINPATLVPLQSHFVVRAFMMYGYY